MEKNKKESTNNLISRIKARANADKNAEVKKSPDSLILRIKRRVNADWFEHGLPEESWCNCSRVGTFGTESAVRKRGGSRNLPYLNAKPRQIPLLGTYA